MLASSQFISHSVFSCPINYMFYDNAINLTTRTDT